MPNPGNTGKRYVYRHIARAQVSERGGITFTLDCGHALPPYEPSNPPKPWDYQWTAGLAENTISRRIACFECGKTRQ